MKTEELGAGREEVVSRERAKGRNEGRVVSSGLCSGSAKNDLGKNLLFYEKGGRKNPGAMKEAAKMAAKEKQRS